MENLSKKQKYFKKFISSVNKEYCTEIDLSYYVTEYVEDFDTFLEEISNQGGFDIEIVYYKNAMKYLTENDTSLTDSLTIAHEFGFDMTKITSETLASLHLSEKTREEFYEIEDLINDFFNE